MAPVRTAAVLASAEWCHCHPVLAGWSSIIKWLKYWSYPLVVCHGSHGPLIGDLPIKNGDFNNQRVTLMMNGDNIGSHIDILSRRSCQGPRHLLQRSVQRPCLEDLRSPTEILPTELLQRSCQETSYGDLVQKPCEESRGLAWRFIDSLNRDLAL